MKSFETVYFQSHISFLTEDKFIKKDPTDKSNF